LESLGIIIIYADRSKDLKMQIRDSQVPILELISNKERKLMKRKDFVEEKCHPRKRDL
jgi:hypothetical protein